MSNDKTSSTEEQRYPASTSLSSETSSNLYPAAEVIPLDSDNLSVITEIACPKHLNRRTNLWLHHFSPQKTLKKMLMK